MADEVLLRQLDRYLADARRDRADRDLTQRLVEVLRRLVADTAVASAADRAQVRAAVHYLVRRRPARRVSEDVRVVNDILVRLGRPDLRVDRAPEAA